MIYVTLLCCVFLQNKYIWSGKWIELCVGGWLGWICSRSHEGFACKHVRVRVCSFPGLFSGTDLQNFYGLPL